MSEAAADASHLTGEDPWLSTRGTSGFGKRSIGFHLSLYNRTLSLF